MSKGSRFSAAIRQSQHQRFGVCKGGYSTVRIIDLLDFTKFKQSPKWIIGFSDITVLHNHLNTMGFKSIHGIMPISIPKASAGSNCKLETYVIWRPLTYKSLLTNESNRYRNGELVGGNLSILYSLGSPSAIDCKDKILFIEDLDEYLYHIDRMIEFKTQRMLRECKEIIVGSMSK
jgi:muramoyltetrapeptide carboxypeptidase